MARSAIDAMIYNRRLSRRVTPTIGRRWFAMVDSETTEIRARCHSEAAESVDLDCSARISIYLIDENGVYRPNVCVVSESAGPDVSDAIVGRVGLGEWQERTST
jgi:hypothetical protein